MKKKLFYSLLIAVMLAIVGVIYVIAGSTFDFGELAGAPLVGEANWTAWPTLINMVDSRPVEILTEDNTNCDLGEDIGYSEYGDGDANIEWWIQVENLLTPIPTDTIQMVFGGLGSYSGTLWRSDFIWDKFSNYETDHGVVGIETAAGAACPTLYDPIEVEDDTTYRFFGAPGGTYHVYRSQNASGANNGASNGQYFYLMTVEDTDIYGNGTFIDNTTEESWYVVIQADPGTNEIIGCHSEPADPTAVRMGEFTANYDVKTKVVELAWETVSEFDIIGFNVLRGTTTVGLPDKINDELIYADYPGELNGSSYTIKDFDLLMGETYYYWVEIVGNDNPRENIGPQSVRAALFFFLPFFQ